MTILILIFTAKLLFTPYDQPVEVEQVDGIDRCITELPRVRAHEISNARYE